MHIYIYDSALSEKRYYDDLARIETRLTDLGLNGKICRLDTMRDLRGFAKQEATRGAKTFVAVGSDDTLRRVVADTGDLGVPIGFIPVIGKSVLASALGIGSGTESCEALSARLILNLDAISFHDKIIFDELVFEVKRAEFVIDGKYSVLLEDGLGRAVNFSAAGPVGTNNKVNPEDNKLHFVVEEKNGFFSKEKNGCTILPFNKLEIVRAEQIRINGGERLILPVRVELSKDKIKIIAGKDRKF